MAANEARRDLAQKLKLERLLAEDMRRFNVRLGRATVKEYAQTGRTFQASDMQPELTALLAEHYDRVGPEFSDQITQILPADIEATDSETEAIAAALAIFFGTRAPEQSEIITGTNQRDIQTSIDTAIAVSQEEAAAGRPQVRTEIALGVGAILSRKLRGRVTGIASLETQAPAETAKATEAQVLTFQPPSVTGGSLRETPVTKEWVTVGDERVRQAHMLADSQVVTLNQPFSVGGQLLRWPGDSSLGASAGNIINCRCSSVIDAQSVFAIRRQRGEEARTDRTASEQLLTSLGG
jgi:hypothetical protein